MEKSLKPLEPAVVQQRKGEREKKGELKESNMKSETGVSLTLPRTGQID
jgi:hypothetical protein